MRDDKRSLTILNLIFIVLLLALQCVASVFFVYDYKMSNMNAAKKVEADFRNLVWKIETVNSLSRQYEFINRFAYLTKKEVDSLSFIDRIKGMDAIRSFNSVIDASCECALYFADSDCVLTSDGMITLDEYAAFFSGETVRGQEIAEAVAPLPDFRVIPSVQFIYHNNWSKASIFVRKNYTMQNVALFCVVKDAYFDKVRTTVVGEKSSIGIEFENQLFYGRAKGRKIEVPYFNINVFACESFNIISFLTLIFFIFFIVFGLYVTVRVSFIKMFYNINSKIRVFNKEFECGLKLDKGITENLEQLFQVIKEREENALLPLTKNKEALVEVYFKLLLFTEYKKEALGFLNRIGVRDNEPRRIVVGKIPAGAVGYRINNRFVCVEGEKEIVCGAVCGIGTVRYALADLKVSCEEAKTAFNYALLYNKTDVLYERLPVFSSLDIDVDKFSAKLKSNVLSGEKNACICLIDELFDALETSAYEPSEIFKLFEKIATTLNSFGGGTLIFGNEEKSITEFKTEIKVYVLELMEKNSDKTMIACARFDVIKQYVDANFTDSDLSLKYLALKFNYSVSYISKMFVENTSYNYSKYMNMKRVELAKEFLRKNERIGDIAIACGFKQVKTFRAIFKECVGLTPMEFKSVSCFEESKK